MLVIKLITLKMFTRGNEDEIAADLYPKPFFFPYLRCNVSLSLDSHLAWAGWVVGISSWDKINMFR